MVVVLAVVLLVVVVLALALALLLALAMLVEAVVAPLLADARGRKCSPDARWPRGRLMLYVPPTPATQEAGALGFGVRLSCGAGRKAMNNFPLPHAPKSAVVVVSVSV